MGTYNFREALKNKKGAGVKGMATTVSTVATKAYDFRSKLKKGGVAKGIEEDTLGTTSTSGSKTYQDDGYYKDAESRARAVRQSELAKQFEGMTYDQVQEALKQYEEGTDEYEYLRGYTGYSTLEDFDKAIAGLSESAQKKMLQTRENWKDLLSQGTIPSPAKRDIDAKLEQSGFDWLGANPHSKPSTGVTQTGGEDFDWLDTNGVTGGGRSHSGGSTRVEDTSLKDKLQILRNQYALDHASEPYLKLKENEDFEEKSQYVGSKSADDAWWQDTSDSTYEFINNVNGARDSIISSWDKNQAGTPIYTAHPLVQKGLAYMNEDEVRVYNYLYATEGKEKANAFLDEIEVMLTKRASDEQAQSIEKAIDEGGVGTSVAMSALSIPMNIGGGIFGAIDIIGGNPYGYFNQMSNQASAIRQSVGENIEEGTNWQIGNTNVSRFLYDTGMSIGDSALGAFSMGHATAPLMGMTAYQQKAKEMTEAGESEDVIFQTALASGLAEAVFEYISIDKLLKIKNVDGIRRGITETLKQMGIEGSEEVFTEIANVWADDFFRGGNSETAKMREELRSRGFSESEIKTELAKYVGEKIALAGIGGALSGGVMGGVASTNNYLGLRSDGKSIRESDRMTDAFDMASLSPKESEAYKVYTAYAKKGVTADNASDAQLGNLSANLQSDAIKTAKSKKATDEERLGAMIRLADDKLHTPKTTEEKAKEQKRKAEEKAVEQRLETLSISKETVVASTGSATQIEGIKTEDGETVILTSEGEVKASEMKFSQTDAELVAYAEGLSEEKANLFISQYDGKSKVSDYAISFEMAYTYGETGFGADNVLRHKGVLSEAQASEIYKGAMYNKAKALQINVDAINAKHSSATTFVEGTFKDDVINYGEEDVEGKIKFSSLSKTQQGAIRFMQAFAKKAGVNITLVASKVVDGKHVGKNGSYNSENNTIEIDVYAGRIDASVATDAIVNTLSHELTHWMKAKSPAMYRAMQEIAMNNISRYNVDGIVEGEKKRLDEEHKKRKHTDEDAIDEIVARTCEDMLSNSKTARQLLSKLSVEEQKTLVGKAKAYINNVIGWIDELMGVYSSNSAEAKLLREHKEAFEEMSKLWDKALTEAIQTNQSLQKEGIAGEKLSGKGEFQWSDRVSDEFALDATVEQTDGMIAVHNLSEEKLLKTIKLGAFPMPSIAITRASIGHKGFGSISLMFRKDTIDPRVFSSNKVYSGDAWTPTYPSIDYKVNEAVEDRARDKYYELSNRFGYDEVRPLYAYAVNLEDTLNRNDGEKAMLERMYEDTGIMQIYLQDVGKGKVAPIEVETRTEMSKEEIEANRSFAEAIGSDILAEFETPSGENPISHRKEYFGKYKAEIENAYRKVLVEHYGLTEEEAQSELDATKPMKMATILRNALQYIKTNGVTVRVEVDREATDRAIREASGDGYKAWVDSLFKGAEEKTGIRNDKDTFTASGNRRSWDVLHYEETLENVIKAMREQGEKGIGVFGGNTNIFGVSAKDLTSMAEIREAGKRLRNVSQEEFGEMKDSFLGRFRSMADSLRKQDGWQALDSASELLVEAVSKHKTREGIAGFIKREGKGWTNYSDSIVDDLIALVNDIRKMPVNYFEAKPMRAVGFDEVACAIIPNNTSENVRTELSRLSIPMMEYEAGDEDARVEALASVEGVQFSDRGTWSSKDIENYHAFGEQINSLLSHEFDESNNLLVLNKTPDLLQKIGLDDKKILMTVKHFRNIVHPKGKNPHWHGLSYAQVKEAPIILEHPAIVVDSMTQSNAVIVISDLLDNDGNPIIISIATDGKGTHEYQMIPSNFLTSMYGREKFNNFITNLLKQNKILYIDNKKSHDLYKNLGLQLPSAFTQIGFDKIIQQSKNIVKAQNSDRDSQGSILTEEQQKYFANSQVRDANGSLKVMYHGTGETFTVFDKKKAKSSGYYGSGFYFTESESHASQYGSSHKVYLNITNPLHDGTNDITKAQLKKFVQAIADNEDYGIENYGYGATVDSVVDSVWGSDDFGMIMDLNATCIGDMVEATLLFNEVNGSTYDGIFVPTETVAFYPNQIKNTDNENPTSDADIRYSDRETTSVFDTMGESERLKRENARLKDDIARLRERLALEKKITNGNTFNENQLRAVAKHLIKTANTEYDEKALIDDLREVYTYIATTPNLEWEDLMVRAYDVANGMMRKQRPTKITNDYFKQVLKDIRQTRISLSADQIAEAKSAFGEKYRNAFLGRVMLVNDGTSLDRQWQEWASQYPEIFDENVSVPDQIIELASILDSLKDGAEVFHTYNDIEATRELAVEIYNQYWNVSTIRTTADKYDKQIKRLNFEHRKAMDEMRSDFKQRLAGSTAEKQKLADSIHYGKIIKRIRDQRDTKVKEARELGKKRMTDYKDRVARSAEIQKITKKALTLNQWLKKNSKDEHIPEIMKEPVAYLLDAIDFSSKQLLGMTGGARANTPTRKDLSLSKAFEKVHDMVQGITSVQIGEDNLTEIYGTFADFPVGFADDVKMLSSVTNDIMRDVGDNAYVLNDMTLEQLEELNRIITVLKATVGKMNKFLAIRHAEGVASMAQQDIVYLDSLGKRKTYDGVVGGTDKMIQWGNATPHYAFKRFGEGGKKVMDAIKDGWDSYSFHIKEIIDYTEKAYTSEEAKAWAEDVKEFDILIPPTEADLASDDYKPQYQKVQMTVPQIMALYCTVKREQAKTHLFGGGMRVTDFKTKKGTVSQPEGAILTESEIAKITGSLTDRQREVADALQRFMNTTCSDWGNEVSMLRFGIKQFGEENYFPIQSDRNNLAVDDETERNNSLFRLLNMSFTKSLTEGANNRIVIGDIFDIFAQHTSDMAKYNSMALPILDAFKWYNYKEKVERGNDTQFTTMSLKQSLETAFGKDAQNYITTLLKDINGAESGGRDSVGKGFFTNAKIASVGLNARVVALQPTSYVRASAVIDSKYLAKAFTRKPNIKMAEQYCGIALWKSLGFFDINIQKSVTTLIKHDQTAKDKIVEASMKGAEMADKLTWGYLWNACEIEIREQNPNLVGEELYKKVGLRLREVIYSTQVVDSTITRSQMMRSKDGWDKMATAFMSEPTLSYNMLQDCYYDWKLTERQSGSKEKAFKKHGKKLARVFTAYTVTNMLCAVVEAGFDFFRDTDDEEITFEDFMKQWGKNLRSDMSILAKIPYAKELVSMFEGYSASRTDTQWMQSLATFSSGIVKLFEGRGNAYKTAKDGLKAFSYATGLPFFNAWRDSTALFDAMGFEVEELEEMFNETIGDIFPSLKSK